MTDYVVVLTFFSTLHLTPPIVDMVEGSVVVLGSKVKYI